MQIRVASVSFCTPGPYPINYITFKFEVAGDPARHVYDPLLTLYMKILNFDRFLSKKKAGISKFQLFNN